MMVNIVMYFQKNFYLKDAINNMLSEIAAAGLLDYYTEKYANKKYYNMKSVQQGPTKLNMQHLFGIFNIYLIGCALGLISFVLEFIAAVTKRALWLKKFHKTTVAREKETENERGKRKLRQVPVGHRKFLH